MNLNELCSTMHSYQSALIAFSGGVDSSVVAAVAHRALGDAAIAVTVDNGALHHDEVEHAALLAKAIGIRHISITLDPLTISEIKRNDPQRCYHCKRFIFGSLRNLADELHLKTVMDGTNASDLDGYRPGLKALQELGIVSPLMCFTKEEVRAFARKLGLSNGDAPSVACLLTSFPYGTVITAARIARVREAERALKAIGISKAKIRDHDGIARIEVDLDDSNRLIAHSSEIAATFSRLGFTYVTLDLEWYRSGSMDAWLP